MKAKDIVLKAKRIADIVNSKYVNQEEDKEILNEAYRALWQILTGTSTDWLLKTEFIPKREAKNVNGYQVFPPPENMAKLRGVKIKKGETYTRIEKAPKLDDGDGIGYRLAAENQIQLINSRYSDYDGVLVEYYKAPKEIRLSLLPYNFKVFGQNNMVGNVFFYENKIYFTTYKPIDGVEAKPVEKNHYEKVYGWVLDIEKDKITAIEAPILSVFNNYVLSIKKFGGEDIFGYPLYRKEAYFQNVFVEAFVLPINTRLESFARDFEQYGIFEQDGLLYFTKIYAYPVEEEQGILNIEFLKKDCRLLGFLSHEEADYSLRIKKAEIKIDAVVLFRIMDGWAMVVKEEEDSEFLNGLVTKHSLRIGNKFSDVEKTLKGEPVEGVVLIVEDIVPDIYLNAFNNSDPTSLFLVERAGALRVNGRNLEYNFSDGTIKKTDYIDKNFLSGSESDQVYTSRAEGNFILYCDLNDNIELPCGVSYDWLAYYIAECYLRKQEKDVSQIRAIRAEKEAQLLSEMNIDEYRPSKIANVFGTRRF